MTRRVPTPRALLHLCRAATWLPVIVLVSGLCWMAWQGLSVLSMAFLWDAPAPIAEDAGVGPALAGSLWLLAISAVLAIPTGVCAGIYLEEFATPGVAARLMDRALGQLSSMPSVVYGLLGLALFVRALPLGKTLWAGGLTLALLVLPHVIEETRLALRRVPRETRTAALALGASPWRVVVLVVLPHARPGAGVMRALARGIGETAPLVMLGTFVYANFNPSGPSGPLLSLPVQAFQWLLRGQPGFTHRAAAAILVLLAIHFALHMPWILRARRPRGASTHPRSL